MAHSAHPRTLEKKQERRDDAHSIGINEEFIATFVDEFYGRIRNDAMLGPIFDQRIRDWPEHLSQMNRFWQAILLGNASFTGNPMLKHVAIPDLTGEHFAHWLNLFYATLKDLDADPQAIAMVGGKARMIASSLLNAIYVHQHGQLSAPSDLELPYV